MGPLKTTFVLSILFLNAELSIFLVVMVSAIASDKKRGGRRNQEVNPKDKVDNSGKMAVTGEKTLLKAVTFFDSGISQQGKSLTHANL